MTTLSTLPRIGIRRKKRLGRGYGSGVGAKSSRGTTRHQKAREGIKIWFEGGQNRIIKKFPLLRGKSRNKSIQQKNVIVLLSDLSVYAEGDIVDVQSLIEKGVIDKNTKKVKILSSGKIDKKLSVKIPISKSAAKQIEIAGGTVI